MVIKRHRRVLRVLFGFGALCAILAGLLILVRTTLVEFVLRRQLATAGVEVRELHIVALGLRQVRLGAILAYSSAVLAIDDLRIDYELGSLRRRVVNRVVIERLDLKLDLRDATQQQPIALQDALSQIHPSRLPVQLRQFNVAHGLISVALPQRVIDGTVGLDLRRPADRHDEVEGAVAFQVNTTEGGVVGELVALHWRPNSLDARVRIDRGQFATPELQLHDAAGVAAVQLVESAIRVDAGASLGSLATAGLCVADLEVQAGLSDSRWLIHAHGRERAGVDGWAALTVDRRFADPIAALELLLEARASDREWGTLSVAARTADRTSADAGRLDGDGRFGLVLHGASIDGLDGIDAELVFDIRAGVDTLAATLRADGSVAVARLGQPALGRVGISSALAAQFPGPVRVELDRGLTTTLSRSNDPFAAVVGRARVLLGRPRSRGMLASSGFSINLDRTGAVQMARFDGLTADLRHDLATVRVAGSVATAAAGSSTKVAGQLEVRLAAPTYADTDLRATDVDVALSVGLGGDTRNLDLRLATTGLVRIGGLEYAPMALTAPIELMIESGEATVSSELQSRRLAYQFKARTDGFAVQLATAGAPVARGRVGSVVVKGDGRHGMAPHEVVVDGLDLTVPDWVALDHAAATVLVRAETASLKVGAVRDLRPTPLVAPFQVVGDLSRSGKLVQLTADGGWNDTDPRRFQVQAAYDIDTRQGRCDLSVRPWNMASDAAAIRQVVPSLGSVIATAGTVDVGASLQWTDSAGVTGTALMALKDFSFSTPEVVVEGLNLAIDFIGLEPLRSAPRQTATARKIDIGAAVTDFAATFSVVDDDGLRLDVAHAEAGFVDGKLMIDNTPFRVDQRRQTIELELQDLDLSELLKQIGVDGLSGTGKVSGIVPLLIGDDGIELAQGRLEAISPGVLRYRSERGKELLAQGGDSVVLMLQALEDFRYDELVLKLRRGTDGETRIEVTTLGSNPRVLNGYPFRINIGLDGNTQSIVGALDRAYRLRRGLEQEWLLRMRKQ